MNRSTRAISAAALTATVALTGAPMASAAPPAHAASHGHATVKVKDKDKDKDKDKGSDKKMAQQQRQVMRDIVRLDRRFDKAIKDSRLAMLTVLNDVDLKTVVVANVEADRAILAALVVDVESATNSTDLRTVRADLRDLRPENYVKVISVLREAQEVQAEGDDVAVDVTVHVNAAVAVASTITAESDNSAFAEARGHLKEAWELIEATDAETDGDVSDGGTGDVTP